MSLLTSLLSPSANNLVPQNFGVWTMSSLFPVPLNVPVGASNKLPFNILKEGTLTGFNTSTFEFSPSKEGLYNLSWMGTANLAFTANEGTIRESIILVSTYHLSNTTPKLCNLIPLEAGTQCIGVSGDLKLNVGDVVVFGVFHNRTTLSLQFTTTLRISFIK